MAKLRIGSRGSQLALWQANHVAALLRSRGHEVTIEVIKTTGDKITEVALSMVGTKGMFTKEIEEALADRGIDLAVHSLKDVPTQLAPEFELAAIMERDDPRDVFVSVKFASLSSLPAGARVGTSSLRRQAQLKAMLPNVDVRSLRGNVDTRLRKLESGEYDAIILAHSGLRRLKRTAHVREVLDPSVVCPAAGQGALAIETRTGDADTRQALAFLDHAPTCASVICERAALNSLGGGCQVPIGVFAQMDGRVLRIQAVVAAPDGTRVIRLSLEGDAAQPVNVGEEMGRELLAAGAEEILNAVYSRTAIVPEQP
jgi:hydroxymethylbilane synthase